MPRKPASLRNLDHVAKANSDNRKAAEIILASPERYNGLPLEWARLWLASHPRQSPDTTKNGTNYSLWNEDAKQEPTNDQHVD